MPFNGVGVFVRVYNWATDRANQIPVSADRVDTEDTGFATGLSNTICRDGQSTITNDIPFANHKITGLANGTLRTDAATVGQTQDNAPQWSSVTAGTANAITLSPSPAILAYAAGQVFRFQAVNTNTDATTISISGLPVKDVQINGVPLRGGEISSSPASTYEVIYDGTAFQLLGAEIAPVAGGNFQPSQQATPNMTVAVSAGNLLSAGTLTLIAAQSTTTIAAPVGNPRNDLVYINSITGAVGVATGTPAATPLDPVVPPLNFVIARVRLQTSSTSITNTMIDDLRLAFQESPSSTVAFAANRNGTDQTGIPSATQFQLALSTAPINVGGYYNTGPSRWTPPAGLYLIIAQATFSAGVVDQSALITTIRKNNVAAVEVLVRASSTNPQSARAESIVVANGTDFFDMWVFADGTGNKTVSGTVTDTFFQGTRIGSI